jgi:hypothetical protein
MRMAWVRSALAIFEAAHGPARCASGLSMASARPGLQLVGLLLSARTGAQKEPQAGPPISRPGSGA